VGWVEDAGSVSLAARSENVAESGRSAPDAWRGRVCCCMGAGKQGRGGVMGPQSAPRLRGEGVVVRYGRRSVLEGVSLEVKAGELVVVLGPNGAGKSSLVKALSGTLPLAAGRVLLEGDDLAGLARRDVARRVTVVPQHTEVAMGFRVRDVVAMGRAPFQGALLLPSADDRAALDHALDCCSLGDLADRRVDELSGGEQRRVAIARALCQGSPTLLLDEPGAHLDLRHAHALHELLRAEISARSLACVLIAHDLNVAAQYADRVLLLAGGRVVADGSVPDVMTYAKLKDIFGVDLYVGVNEIDGSRYFLPMRGRGGGA
jgi:iron complex transport system ATP-binding protein